VAAESLTRRPPELDNRAARTRLGRRLGAATAHDVSVLPPRRNNSAADANERHDVCGIALQQPRPAFLVRRRLGFFFY